MAALVKRLRAEEAERKREQAERDGRLEKTLNRIAGDGDHRWGQLMEALVGGDLVRLLRDAGLDVEVLGRDVRSQNREGVWREYDLVAAGRSLTVVVEVKTVEVVDNEVVVRGRDVHERCDAGGVNPKEAWEMHYFMDVDCKDGEPDHPPSAQVYTAPELR